MIRIVTEGKDLVLNRSTTMTVELNNALFANPDVEGDVSFTFTLPVDGNERLLGFPNMPQSGGARKMPCTVYCNGSLSWNGSLVVQKASFNTLSAALVINPYPDGFGKRMMTENEDNAIVISDSLSAHDTVWAQFLAASIHDSDIKFAPFFNADGYGSDNDSWGFWNGYSRRKVVNELFFDADGNIIESQNYPFSQTNNKTFYLQNDDEENPETDNSYTEINQLAFCPQIRLTRIMDLWCRNAGYTMINHIGDDLNNTFLQSQKSLDGTRLQYEKEEALLKGTTKGLTNEQINSYDQSWFHIIDAETGSELVNEGIIYPPAVGWYEITFTSRLDKEQLAEKMNEQVSGINFFFASHRKEMKIKNEIRKFGFKVAVFYGYKNIQELSYENTIMLSTMYAYDSERNEETYNSIMTTGKIKVTQEMIQEGIRVLTFRKKLKSNTNALSGFKYWPIDTGLNVRMDLVSVDIKQFGFNIFRRQFRIAETLPEVSNSAFLKTMLETMGLCYFVSGKTKKVEIVPYAKLRNAKSLDLTEWELTRETEIQSPEETQQTFRLKPLKDDDYNKELRLADTSGNHLPDAYANHEHLTLLTKTNTLYRASMQEHEDMNWVEAWEEYSGNPDKLETGNGELQNHEPGVSIPHQRFVGGGRIHPETDTATGETPQLMVADFTISSDLYNTGDKPSDIILTQYRGLRKREYYSYLGHYVWNEVMLPVWNGEFSLTAKGDNSLGEKYVKPVLELANHKTITYKLRLPANMMQPVENLLRPSELPPERQTRFIVIRNVKTVPKKITFQIDNSIDDTVLCQIEAVKVY